MVLSAVILSKTDSEASFRMTSLCLSSLIDSEPDTDIEIIIVESNKAYYTSGFAYPEQVQVIIPGEAFNFHKFLNIGVKAATGDFIALCNNDLKFHPDWFSEIKKVADSNKEILSFSPSGKPNLQHKTYELGYRVMIHLMGWCFVVRREVFDKIGPLDETFDFYFADNDYAMTLKYHNIRHAVVYNSYVEHLEKDQAARLKVYEIDPETYLYKYQVPDYLKAIQYAPIVGSEMALSGFLKYHNKWGTPKSLYRKNKIADLLFKNHLGFLVRYFIKIK